MISIDPKTQGIGGSTKLKKPSISKDRVKFTPNKKTQKTNSGEATSSVADISGLLFLQEIDQRSQDQQNLEEFGKKAFDTLKYLQMDLLQGNINERHIYKLKDTMQSSKFIIDTPHLTKLSEEIKLRLEVEIAKIEVCQK
jgi:hypothetical protein